MKSYASYEFTLRGLLLVHRVVCLFTSQQTMSTHEVMTIMQAVVSCVAPAYRYRLCCQPGPTWAPMLNSHTEMPQNQTASDLLIFILKLIAVIRNIFN